jgi:hypothetical protein
VIRLIGDVLDQITWPIVHGIAQRLPYRWVRWLHEPPEDQIVA